MTIISRRALLGAGIIGLGGSLAGRAQAQTNAAGSEELVGDFPDLPGDWKAYDQQPDIAMINLAPNLLGTATPTSEEILTAQRILSGAPHGTKKPIDVARYFADIGRGTPVDGVNIDIRHFVRGWPLRYNPVIVNFFVATGTNPLALQGDYTAWCAAFVNWCIARSFSPDKEIILNDKGLMPRFAASTAKGTKSASSGSFRCWSDDATQSPTLGDVIVWATAGTVSGCSPGKGHVGFYTGKTADGRYLTLGGNQRDPSINQSAVVEKRIGTSFKRSDGSVDFFSIRRMVAT